MQTYLLHRCCSFRNVKCRRARKTADCLRALGKKGEQHHTTTPHNDITQRHHTTPHNITQRHQTPYDFTHHTSHNDITQHHTTSDNDITHLTTSHTTQHHTTTSHVLPSTVRPAQRWPCVLCTGVWRELSAVDHPGYFKHLIECRRGDGGCF